MGESQRADSGDLGVLIIANDVDKASFPIEPAIAARSLAKRGLDLVIGSASLLVLGPLLIVLAIAIRLESPGRALFRQRRTGLGGRSFTVYKLRTMVASAAPNNAPAEKNDPRITKLGALLRRSSLDELPQVLNVLRGEMSLVGPRPHAVDHDIEYLERVPGYSDRFRVRPGITGLSQIQGSRGGGEINEIRRRTLIDNEYIDRWSLLLDIKILLMTIPHLVFFKAH